MSTFLMKLDDILGQVALYDDKVVISRSGLLAISLYGTTGDKTIPINQITAVEFRDPKFLIDGYLKFYYLGSTEKTPPGVSKHAPENAVSVSPKNSKIAREIKYYIEKCI